MERMLRGGFASAGLLADALLIALLDTGVPVWALDARSLDGELGIRVSGDGEQLGRAAAAPALAAGGLVVADASTPLAVLFGELAPGHEPRAEQRPRDAVRAPGRRRAVAVRRGGAVDLQHRART